MKNIDLSHLVGKDISIALKEAQDLSEKAGGFDRDILRVRRIGLSAGTRFDHTIIRGHPTRPRDRARMAGLQGHLPDRFRSP